MKETVLYYTPSVTPYTSRLKGTLVTLGIRIKNIAPEQVTQKVGYLAGMEGYREEPVKAPLPVLDQEMLIMHQFTGRRIDTLLMALRKAGVPRIALKAIVTESNCDWTFYELYEELKKEHEAMSGQS